MTESERGEIPQTRKSYIVMTRCEHVLTRVRTYTNWPTLVWPLTRLLPRERVMNTRSGRHIYVRDIFGPDFTVVHEQFFRNDYMFTPAMLKNASPIIIDCGANIGAFSLFALSAIKAKGGKIFAYEPDELNFEILQKNIALNEAESIIISHKEALHTQSGEQEFFLSKQAYAHSLVREQLDGEERGASKVACTTIESIINTYSLEVVDLIKMDIEGSEYEVLYQLPAALYQKIKNIVLEIHVRSGYAPGELVRFLEEQGFSVSRSSGNSHVYTARRDCRTL